MLEQTCQDCAAPMPWAGICPTCREQRREQHRRGVLTQRLEHGAEEQALAGIPLAFRSSAWQLPEWATAYLDGHRGLCLTGPSGAGKTTALCLLMRDFRKSELEAMLADTLTTVTDWRFVSVPKLIMELQDTWRKGDDEQTALDRLNDLVRVERLILDDLGAEKLTDYVRQALYYLLNEREQWQRPTYLTTNFSLSQLDEQLDSRLSSRIAGMCDVKALKGKDRRLER